MEREQQRKEREQEMEIDQQGGGNIINIVKDRIVSSIVRIFRYWTSPQ
jgi:hypothetical protein